MRNLKLHTDKVNHKIQIIEGFEVDYNPALENKDFNNGGTWGKIINKGKIVKSIHYDPNRTAPNFGESDYASKLNWMNNEMNKMLIS